jgi:hypothetical protein
MRGVDDRARPVDPAGFPQLGEQDLMEALPNTRLLPLVQPPPAGHA